MSEKIDKRTKEYKAMKAEAEKTGSEKVEPAIPFKEGQIICDIKIMKINPNGYKPIEFVTAKRDTEGGITRGKDGKLVRTPATGNIIRDQWGQVIWSDEIRLMTLDDFADFAKKRPRYTSML